jgi:hypothetical protein|uniref:Uncharacterized protein n=1 Tax=viral metagenome TaxID=1070528 RepID=A0A6C0CYD9_9ZZZZ
MEARRKARSMKRSASMGRAASRSAARGKAISRARGRARRGGEDDLEMGLKEQYKQDITAMEEGRSPSPPTNYNPPPPSLSTIERGLAPKRISPTYGTQSKGGKRRRSKKFYKGKASKTRKGRKDFVTHKGDKDFHRKGHRQTKRQGKSKGLFEQLFGL